MSSRCSSAPARARSPFARCSMRPGVPRPPRTTRRRRASTDDTSSGRRASGRSSLSARAGSAGSSRGGSEQTNRARRSGIPAPSSPAADAPAGFDAVDGISPFFTPNDRFYRVDTALLVPAVTAEDWQLRIHGMVDRETHAHVRAAARASADRARRHAHLRLESRRRSLPGQRALDRRTAAGHPRGGGRAARRGPAGGALRRRVHRRHADRGAAGWARRDARGRR